MERELFFDLVPSKTSVDSGVDTGNDSNDSHTTFDSQSGRYIPGEYFRTFEIPIPNSSVKNPNTNTTREEANGSVEVGEHGKIEVIICEGDILSVLGYKHYTFFSNLLC